MGSGRDPLKKLAVGHSLPRFPGSLSALGWFGLFGLFVCSEGLQDSAQPAVDASAGPSVYIMAIGANIAGANGIHDGFVSRVNTDGTQATSAVQPPSQVFNGIAAGADGSLYVTGETNRSLYRIRP